MKPWFENKEVYIHRGYDYRRKNSKFWLVLIIILIIAGAYAYQKNINGFGEYVNSLKYKLVIENNFISIKDLNQNPENYLSKNVSVSGDLTFRVGGYSLDSSDGYWIWLNDNCIESQRNYDNGLHAPSSRYSAKGTLLYTEGIGFGFGSKYYLSCTYPIE